MYALSFSNTEYSIQGTGIQIGMIILAVTSIAVALALSFSGSWELTFVLVLVIPLIIISNRVLFAMYSGVQSEDEISIASASHIVVETVENIKTVAYLGAEDYFVKIISRSLSLQLRCVSMRE